MNEKYFPTFIKIGKFFKEFKINRCKKIKKRNAKRKTYLQIFAHKAVPTLIVYGLLLQSILSYIHINQTNNFYNAYSEISDFLIEHLLPQNENPTALSSWLALYASDESDVLNTHAWITDTETGKLIASSDKVFMLRRNPSDSSDPLDAIFLTCDYDLIKDRIGEYVNPSPENPILSMSGYLEYSYEDNKEDEYFYQYKMDDMYYTDTTFYPGTLHIELCQYDDFGRQTSCKQVASMTLAPENPENYEYMQFHSETDNRYPFISGDSSSIEDFPLAVETMNENPAFTSATSDDDGIVQTYNKQTYTDALGHEYTLHYAVWLDYWAVAGKCLMLCSVIVGLFILGIAALIAKKEYNTLRSFYQQNDYRKSLMDAMAHDLKTPLMAMGGYAENLKENINTDKREHYADAILQNTNYMNEIISRNLTLSEFESMTDLPQKDSVNVTELCNELMKKYALTLEEKHCKYSITGNYVIKGNREYLAIALENLLSNAIKYVNPYGSIEIIGCQKVLTLTNTTDQKLSVAPNKLWEPFVKGDESRSNQKGTGLGLTIAKSVLDMHGLSSRITTDEREELSLFTVTIK